MGPTHLGQTDYRNFIGRTNGPLIQRGTRAKSTSLGKLPPVSTTHVGHLGVDPQRELWTTYHHLRHACPPRRSNVHSRGCASWCEFTAVPRRQPLSFVPHLYLAQAPISLAKGAAGSSTRPRFLTPHQRNRSVLYLRPAAHLPSIAPPRK